MSTQEQESFNRRSLATGSSPRQTSWSFPEQPTDGGTDEVAAWAPLVNLEFLRSALRRRRRVWWLAALVGFLLGLSAATLVSPTYSAKTTLLLTHDKEQDPDRAVATDLSLLQTRAVARRALDELHLPIAEDPFLSLITSTKASDSIITITVKGGSPGEATARTSAVGRAFLSYRADVLTAQSNVFVDGLRSRMNSINSDIATLTSQINSTGAAGSTDLSDLVSRRTQEATQLNSLQEQADNSTLSSASVVSTSRVLDPAAAAAQSSKKRLVIDPLAGLIVGGSLGMGFVAVEATISYRARRREDVATALGVPVAVCVPPPPRWPSRGPSSTRTAAQTVLRRRLLELTCRDRWSHPAPASLTTSKPRSVALTALEDARVWREVVIDVATEHMTAGTAVLLVDLTTAGVLDGVTVAPVFRPTGSPSLAIGPLDPALPLGGTDVAEAVSSYSDADVVLVLTDVDLNLGADSLRSWATDAVVGIVAGRSTVEQIHSVAEVVWASGVDLRFGVLFDADETDGSLGTPRSDDSRDATRCRLVGG